MASKANAIYPLDNLPIGQGWGANPADYAAVGQRGHNGWDFPAAAGTPIRAIDDAVVDFAGWGGNDSRIGAIGGTSVVLEHKWAFSTYNHQSRLNVRAGQKVKKGDIIGYVGATGWATGNHLHHDIIPKSPFWGNGYAGRVNPTSLANYSQRGSTPAGSTKPRKAIDVKTYSPDPKNRQEIGEQVANLFVADAKPGSRAVTIATGKLDAVAYVSVHLRAKPGTEFELRLKADTYDSKNKLKSSSDKIIADVPAVPSGQTLGKAVLTFPVSLAAGQRLRIGARVTTPGGTALVTRVAWALA